MKGLKMTNLTVLEAAAIRTQEDAGRAWADLQACPRASDLATLQANYDAAKRIQDEAFDAWKRAGGVVES